MLGDRRFKREQAGLPPPLNNKSRHVLSKSSKDDNVLDLLQKNTKKRAFDLFERTLGFVVLDDEKRNAERLDEVSLLPPLILSADDDDGQEESCAPRKAVQEQFGDSDNDSALLFLDLEPRPIEEMIGNMKRFFSLDGSTSVNPFTAPSQHKYRL
jgi:hypothetical protein